MPLVTSPGWFAEKLARYQICDKPARFKNAVSESMQNGGDFTAGGLADFTPLICSRILATDPALVAEVTAGRTSRQALISLIARIVEEESLKIGYFLEDLQQQVMAFLFGYGLLQPYIENEEVSDIDGTGPSEFSIKLNGSRQALPLAFPDARTYDTFCRLVIIRNGGIINENDSHCRVSDGKYRLRINVTVPPRSINGASISIRKHRLKNLSLHDLKVKGMLDSQLETLFKKLALTDATVLFCGKGAAGKTTLLRAFIEALPQMERVLIAESDSELYPEKPYCLVQRIKKLHEGGHPISLRDLIADGLTMSLDTYCIGEIVGDEALEFMRAAFSGHRCLATTHAESAEDALDRLLSLARPAANGESDRILKRMLAKSVHYVVFLRSFRVEQVLRIHGYQESEDVYEMAEIWPSQQDAATDAADG